MAEHVARVRESGAAFREHSVYDSEGDEVRLIVQADECDKSADILERLSRERARQSATIAKARGEIEAQKRGVPDLWDKAIDRCLDILAQIDAPARADEGVDAHREDMANVGEYLMDTLESNRQHPLLKHWLPADNPAEIVVDLLNAYDDKAAQLDALTKGVAAAKEAIVAKMQTEKKPGVAQGLQFAVATLRAVLALIDGIIPPAAQPASPPMEDSQKHIVADDNYCHAARSDGECNWTHCPQLRDNEPHATGRSCPRPWWFEDEDYYPGDPPSAQPASEGE